jgi:hypothetical protein
MHAWVLSLQPACPPTPNALSMVAVRRLDAEGAKKATGRSLLSGGPCDSSLKPSAVSGAAVPDHTRSLVGWGQIST